MVATVKIFHLKLILTESYSMLFAVQMKWNINIQQTGWKENSSFLPLVKLAKLKANVWRSV